MPTTQLLDDEIGDDAEGQLKPIAGFAQKPITQTPQPAAAPEPSHPASTATTAPAPHATAGNLRPNLRTPAISLHGPHKNNAPQPQAQTTAAAPVRNNPFTHSDLLSAWRAFAASISSEHLLANAMRMAEPTLGHGDTWTVSQNQVQIQIISDNIQRILDFVHNTLANDNVSFTLEVASADADSPSVWTDRELLANIVKAHPDTADFIKALDLKLN